MNAELDNGGGLLLEGAGTSPDDFFETSDPSGPRGDAGGSVERDDTKASAACDCDLVGSLRTGETAALGL